MIFASRSSPCSDAPESLRVYLHSSLPMFEFQCVCCLFFYYWILIYSLAIDFGERRFRPSFTPIITLDCQTSGFHFAEERPFTIQHYPTLSNTIQHYRSPLTFNRFSLLCVSSVKTYFCVITRRVFNDKSRCCWRK